MIEHTFQHCPHVDHHFITWLELIEFISNKMQSVKLSMFQKKSWNIDIKVTASGGDDDVMHIEIVKVEWEMVGFLWELAKGNIIEKQHEWACIQLLKAQNVDKEFWCLF